MYMLINEIKNMPLKERVLLMEAIWETLCQDAPSIDSPEWHKDTLDKRREMIESGQAVLYPHRQLQKRNPSFIQRKMKNRGR
jgi:hypothetical protein